MGGLVTGFVFLAIFLMVFLGGITYALATLLLANYTYRRGHRILLAIALLAGSFFLLYGTGLLFYIASHLSILLIFVLLFIVSIVYLGFRKTVTQRAEKKDVADSSPFENGLKWTLFAIIGAATLILLIYWVAVTIAPPD